MYNINNEWCDSKCRVARHYFYSVGKRQNTIKHAVVGAISIFDIEN